MTENYYVTTPIYYVNDSPHIGHSYTTIAADVLARYWRAEGKNVRFLTGTDEHGIKIVKAAGERGTTPKELADEVVVHFQDLWRDLEISHDDFIRTSQPRHEKRVQEIIKRLLEAGQIYLGTYEGWYDESQEEFVTESVARQNDYKGPISGKPLVRYSEPSYYFRLGEWTDKLIEHIEANPRFILPQARRNEVLSKLRLGVEDLSISRHKEKLTGWGVTMPNDEDHVVYVWVDALSNYITALGLPEIGDGDDAAAAEYWPCDVHLIGKDILWFHAVYWPCILMAIDMPLPKCVFAHGWWTSEGKKMSKSLGNFVSRRTISEICDLYSPDVYRYFLLRAVTFGLDGDFSRSGLNHYYNTELANGIGNLLNRTLNMILKYFDGRVPQHGEFGDDEKPVIDAAENLRKTAPQNMAVCNFMAYIRGILDLVQVTNAYIDRTEPFKLAKDESRRGRLGTILYTCAESLRIILMYIGPVMPQRSAVGLEQLGCGGAPEGSLTESAEWGKMTHDTSVKKIKPLFPRVEDAE